MVDEGMLLLSLLLAFVGLSGSYIGMHCNLFTWIIANEFLVPQYLTTEKS